MDGGTAKETRVAAHYTNGNLLASIEDAFKALGKPLGELTREDLSPIDEFHIGGRRATEHFIAKLNVTTGQRVIDVGCGLGGPARFVASRSTAHVDGIDLTNEYVAVGSKLNEWTKCADQVTLTRASALSMPFPDHEFDAGYMIHVGMNIADKSALFAELARVLKPGAVFGIFDIMVTGSPEIDFPMPWSSEGGTSALATPDVYREQLGNNGFDVISEESRREFAEAFFAEQRRQTFERGGPPPVGLHTVIGQSTALKMKNLSQAVSDGNVAPFEIVARRRG